MWVDLSRDANMIDGFYREEARLQENSTRLKATQNTVPLVEVNEMATGEEEEDQVVLKPESDVEATTTASPIKPSHTRRFGGYGRRRRRLKSTTPTEIKRRRPYKRRNRLNLFLSAHASQPILTHKRQRRIPREFEDYESFCELLSPRLVNNFSF